MGVGNFSSNKNLEYGSNGDRNKPLSVEEHFNKIRPYLKDIISNLKKSDTWKIHLTAAIDFISCKDTDEECVIYSKSNNIESEVLPLGRLGRLQSSPHFLNNFVVAMRSIIFR